MHESTVHGFPSSQLPGSPGEQPGRRVVVVGVMVVVVGNVMVGTVKVVVGIGSVTAVVVVGTVVVVSGAVVVVVSAWANAGAVRSSTRSPAGSTAFMFSWIVRGRLRTHPRSAWGR